MAKESVLKNLSSLIPEELIIIQIYQAMVAGALLLKNIFLPPKDNARTCHSSDSLEQVMWDMVESRSECCLLVTDSGQLERVITLRDLISSFSPPSMDAKFDGEGFF